MTDDARRTIAGPDNYSSNFTNARPFAAEGARVAIVTCKSCGCALLIDMSDDFNVLETHAEWHRSLDAMHGWANTKDGQAEVTVRRRSS